MASEVVLDDKQVKLFLRNMEKNLAKVKDGKNQFLGILSAIIFKDVIRHFEKEEGPDGGWKTWSSIYREKMVREGKGGNKILQDSGRMRQNFKPSNYRSSDKGFLWFNDAKVKGFPYAAAHDDGDGLPKREFMWLSDGALEDVTKQTLAFILENDL